MSIWKQMYKKGVLIGAYSSRSFLPTHQQQKRLAEHTLRPDSMYTKIYVDPELKTTGVKCYWSKTKKETYWIKPKIIVLLCIAQSLSTDQFLNANQKTDTLPETWDEGNEIRPISQQDPYTWITILGLVASGKLMVLRRDNYYKGRKQVESTEFQD